MVFQYWLGLFGRYRKGDELDDLKVGRYEGLDNGRDNEDLGVRGGGQECGVWIKFKGLFGFQYRYC